MTLLATLVLQTLLLPAGRALAARPEAGLSPLVRVLAGSDDAGLQRDVLRGMLEALRGRRSVRAPAGWSDVYRKLSASGDAEVRDAARELAVLFGDPAALAELRRLAADPGAKPEARRGALRALLERPSPEVQVLVRDLVRDRAMREPALRALASFNDPGVPALVLEHYPDYGEAERAAAVATLASRPAYALALLKAVGAKRVPRADVSSFTARQLLALKDAAVKEELERVWGTVRSPAKEKTALLGRYMALATPGRLAKADREHGRQVFAKTCASCHVVFGEGGKIGPDLTGSQRAKPEYILGKVLDPNEVVPHDFQVTVLTTTSGRVITGIIKEETEKTLTVQTPTEVLRVAVANVEQRQRQPVSLMLEGQLAALKDEEIRDLLAYLALGPKEKR